jgi:hypothetical protein
VDDMKWSEYISVFALMIIAFLFVGCLVVKKDNETKRLKNQYECETFIDEQTGQTFYILKDKLGDVLYCEPMKVELKRGFEDEN